MSQRLRRGLLETAQRSSQASMLLKWNNREQQSNTLAR
jgi:hypothetical protein